MMPDPTLYKMVAQAQYEEVLRKAEQRRLLVHPPRPRRGMKRRAAGQLGTLLLKLGMWLEQFDRKGHTMMNPHVEELVEMEIQVQATGTETDLLAQHGFSSEEIVALLWLQQWYQTGGSD